jgi:hypothetical protein
MTRPGLVDLSSVHIRMSKASSGETLPSNIPFVSVVFDPGLPELRCEKDLDYVRRALQLDDTITHQEALLHFRLQLTGMPHNIY